MRRPRERYSPEWRLANRQSGDWRSRVSNQVPTPTSDFRFNEFTFAAYHRPFLNPASALEVSAVPFPLLAGERLVAERLAAFQIGADDKCPRLRARGAQISRPDSAAPVADVSGSPVDAATVAADSALAARNAAALAAGAVVVLVVAAAETYAAVVEFVAAEVAVAAENAAALAAAEVVALVGSVAAKSALAVESAVAVGAAVAAVNAAPLGAAEAVALVFAVAAERYAAAVVAVVPVVVLAAVSNAAVADFVVAVGVAFAAAVGSIVVAAVLARRPA